MSDVFVTAIRHLGAHRFWVQFSDGASGEWDYARIKQRPGPVAAPLHDESYAARVFLNEGAPTWPNGWDVSPEALHEDMAQSGALKREAQGAK